MRVGEVRKPRQRGGKAQILGVHIFFDFTIIDDCPEAIFASYLIRVQAKDNLLPTFLAQYFRTNNYWKQINQSKGGRLKGGVNIPILTRLVLPFPSFSEQQEIAETLQACDAKITALEQESARLDELFHAMLDELMTGQRSAVPLIDALR